MISTIPYFRLFCWFFFPCTMQKQKKKLWINKISGRNMKERERKRKKAHTNLFNGHGRQHKTHYQIRLLPYVAGRCYRERRRKHCTAIYNNNHWIDCHCYGTQCSVSKLSWEYAAGVPAIRKNRTGTHSSMTR